MADNVNRTGILKFEVDQQDGITELENLKNIIVGLKLEQAQLNKDFKAGTITQKEYAQESVRVENILKKTNIAYNDQQRAILGVKSFTEKLGDELRKKTMPTMAEFSKQATDAAKNMSVAGVNINAVTSSITQFLTPGSAAVGLLGALGAAYASSASGAEDLAFASDKASASISILSNRIGDALTTGSAGNRKGFFSGLADAALSLISPTLAAQSDLVAQAKQQLRELEIVNIDVQGIRKQYEKAAEDSRRIRDDETRSNEVRLAAAKDVENQLNANLLVRKRTQEQIIGQLQIIASLTGNDPSIRAKIKQAQAEVRDIQEEINGKLTENVKALQQILTLQTAITASQNTQSSGGASDVSRLRATSESISAITPGADIDTQIQVNGQKYLTQVTAKFEAERTANKKEETEKRLKISKLAGEVELEIAASIAGSLASLFDQQSAAYKIFASAETLIATYSSAQKSYDSLAGIPIVGPALGGAAAAAAVVAGLARVAQINEVQFAEGGYTGRGGKYEVAGVVHRGEYVVPKHITHNPEYAGHIAALESARLRGFADGGMVTSQFTTQVDMQRQMINSIISETFSKMPAPQLDIRETSKFIKRVELKESIGIGGKR